jgi:hypothetical protein
METMGLVDGKAGRAGEGASPGAPRLRRPTTRNMRALVVETPERDQPRAARTFLLAIGVLWAIGGLIIDPIVEGGAPSWLAIELRLVGAAVLAVALLLVRDAQVPEPRLWTIVGVAGAAICALDGVVEVMRARVGTGAHDLMPLLVAIAMVATVPPRWRIGAPIVGAWLVVHVGVVIAGNAAGMRLIDQLVIAALEGIALALLVVAGHRIWRLHHDLYESRRLGRFRLMSPIGRGMNEVWLAWDEQRRREVALKLLRTPGAAEATRARFEREAECVHLLRSPRTVRIYDYGVTDDGFAYMALEYLRGLDLDALVTAYGPLEPNRAYHLMLEAARGIAVAHARGIVHRDVKPANLHCADANGSEDFVRILDFGVARSTHEVGLTLDGLVVGTPTYMAPEAFLGGDIATSADVYSLGATFYFALTGQPPFDGASVGALRQAHTHAPVVPPSLRAHCDIPRPLENVILRCLAKRPEDRYPDASAVTAALEACATVMAPWNRELAARWWHHARVGRVPTVMPTTERTTEVEAVPLRASATPG